MVTGMQTIGQWLEELASKNVCSETDSNKMTNLLHRIGFNHAVCVYGIVYLEGKGTIAAPPTDIHSIARMLVAKANKV